MNAASTSLTGLVPAFHPEQMLAVALSIADRASGAVWAFFGFCVVVALAGSVTRFVLGGGGNDAAIVKTLLKCMGIAFVIKANGFIVQAIDSQSQAIAAQISSGGEYARFSQSWASGIGDKILGAADPTSSTFDKVTTGITNVVTGIGPGIAGTILSMASIIGVMVAAFVIGGIQVFLFAVFAAVGPLIACYSLLPGCGEFLKRWFSGLITLGLWPILLALLFEMLGKAGILAVYATDMSDFMVLFAASALLICALFSVPILANMLGGSSFSALSGAVTGMVAAGASLAGNVAGPGLSLAARAVTSVGGGVAGTMNSAAGAVTGSATATAPAPYTPSLAQIHSINDAGAKADSAHAAADARGYANGEWFRIPSTKQVQT